MIKLRKAKSMRVSTNFGAAVIAIIHLVLFISIVGCSDSSNDSESDSASIEQHLISGAYKIFQDYYLFPELVRVPNGEQTLAEYIGGYHSSTDIYTEYFEATEMNDILQTMNSEERLIKRVYDSSIIYIAFDFFVDGTADRVSEAIDSYIEQGYDSLILDLRVNTGGYPDEASALLAYFLEEPEDTKIFSAKGPTFNDSFETGNTFLKGLIKDRKETVFDLSNMFVLTSGVSASATEILVGGLTDFEEATQVGSATFGKFRLIRSFRTNREDGFFLTVAKGYNSLDIDELYDRESIGYTPDPGYITDEPFEKVIVILGGSTSDPLKEDWGISNSAYANLYSKDYWRGYYGMAALLSPKMLIRGISLSEEEFVE